MIEMMSSLSNFVVTTCCILKHSHFLRRMTCGKDSAQSCPLIIYAHPLQSQPSPDECDSSYSNLSSDVDYLMVQKVRSLKTFIAILLMFFWCL